MKAERYCFDLKIRKDFPDITDRDSKNEEQGVLCLPLFQILASFFGVLSLLLTTVSPFSLVDSIQ